MVNPDDGEARFGLGCVYAALGERDRAVEEWRRCLELNPEMGEAHYALAWAHYEAGDYETAYRHVEMAHRSGVSLESLKNLIDHFVKTGRPIEEPSEKVGDTEIEEIDRSMKKRRRIILIASLLSIISLTIYISYYVEALGGFPKGVDAYAHLAKIKYMTRHWPNFHWNYQWDGGVPLFGGSYPPLTYYLASGFTVLTGCSPEFSLKFLAAASFCLNSVALLGFLHRVTRSPLGGFIGVSLLLLTPAYWSWWVYGGNYARVIAMGFLGLSLYLASLDSSRAWGATAASLTLAVASHLVIGASAILTIIVYILTLKGFRDGLKNILSLLLIVAGLDGFYVTQFLFSNPTAGGIFGSPPYGPVPLRNLIFLKDIETLNILLLPGLTALSVMALPLRSRFRGRRVKAALAASMAIAFTFLLYSLVGYLPGYPRLYIDGFPPSAALCMVSIGIALSVAILSEVCFRSFKGGDLTLLALLIITLIFGFTWYLPIIKNGVIDQTRPETRETLTKGLVVVDHFERWQRLGTDSAYVSIWFNYLYDTPQSRGYYAQGVPHRDWHVWLEHAVWFEKENHQETNLLLDWFAIRWIVVGHPHFNYEKFLSKPEYYRPVGQLEGWWEFEYLNASVILSATNAPPILFIGSQHHYDVFLRVLSLTGLRSGECIPVLGPSRYVDFYDLEELRRFPVLILYGYDYKRLEKMSELLLGYVAEGGCLFFEANASPDYEADHLPDPFPVRETHTYSIVEDWAFNISDHPISQNVNFASFSPPIYDEGGWGVSTSYDIAEWAKPILASAGSPLIVVGEYGRGRVVWSGVNLFYHAKGYRNGEEAKFIARILMWLGGVEKRPLPEHDAEFVNPQRRIVELKEPARGILFKESYFPQWHAALIGEGRKERLRIYLAGPGLMYVPLPDVQTPSKVILWYDLSPPEKAGYIISGVSLIALIIVVWKRPQWLYPIEENSPS
jgi:hypothetical protein